MIAPHVHVPDIWRPGLRISLFYTAFFAMVGVYQPFFPLWLESRGLDASQIGWAIAAGVWLRVGVNPAVMRLADWRGERKRFALCFASAALLAAACFPLAHGFWPVLAVVLLFAFAHGPVLPLADNIALLTARARQLDYGRLRVWGSIAFILVSWAGGWLLAGHDDSAIMMAVIGALALIAAATAFLPDARPAARRSSAGALHRLLRDRGFLLCALAVGCNMASHAVLLGFGTIHWEAAGHGKEITGPLWAAGTIAEVALFALGNRIVRRLGIAGLIALGASAALMRWAGTALVTDLWLLAPIQMLHGLTFGATYLGGMTFLQRHIAPEISATAQGLYSSAMAGMTGLMLPVSGWLYEAFAGGAFWFMAALSVCSLLLAGALARHLRARTPAGGDAP